MPRTSLTINSTVQARKKKSNMVRRAMASSDESAQKDFVCAAVPLPPPVALPRGSPCTDRPSAFRMMVSRRSSAATIAGEEGAEDSTDSSMVEVGIGGGK